MPEELKLLPCPACGAISLKDVKVQDVSTLFNNLYNVTCGICCTSGPVKSKKEEAVTCWNSLPRTLTWTTSPPKVVGWYMYLGQKSNGLIILLKVTQEDLCTDKGMVEDFGMWAGPVTMPEDSKL